MGIDAYSPRAGLRELRRRTAALVGSAAPIPIAFEVGVGFAPWLPPLDDGPAEGPADGRSAARAGARIRTASGISC